MYPTNICTYICIFTSFPISARLSLLYRFIYYHIRIVRSNKFGTRTKPEDTSFIPIEMDWVWATVKCETILFSLSPLICTLFCLAVVCVCAVLCLHICRVYYICICIQGDLSQALIFIYFASIFDADDDVLCYSSRWETDGIKTKKSKKIVPR